MQAEFCCLCRSPCHNLSQPIEEEVMESLAQILPHLRVITNTRGTSQAACGNCSTSLRGYLELQPNFLRGVQSFGTEQSNLIQGYLRNEGNKSEVSIKELVVCHFCLKQAIGAYVSLVEDQKELILVAVMMRKCFPGLDLGTMNGCVICNSCHEALGATYNFLLSLDVQNCIKKEDAVEEMGFEEGPNVKSKLFKSDKFSSGSVELNAVKEEDHDFGSFNVKQELENEFKVITEDIEIKEEDVDVKEHNLSSLGHHACDVIAEQAAGGSVKEKTYKCEICPYETKQKRYYTRHLLVHKNASEVPIYKCEACSYVSKYKENYNQHKRIHKDRSEVTTYKCSKCPFESRFKVYLTKHALIHKNPSEVTMYKCQHCAFETRHKHSMLYHELNHKNTSDVETYKCDECSFQTKHKKNYNRHLLVHKNLSQVTSFKCPECPYITKYKGCLKEHALTHKSRSEMTMYKCQLCPYKTKVNWHHTRHMASHKNVPASIAGYACAVCPCKTKEGVVFID